MELTAPMHERIYGDVINPPIPERGKEKLRLLQYCLGALAYGHRVEGITPHHVTPDGMYLINQYQKPARVRSGL